MPRKGPAPRRELVADPIHKSVLVTQITNKVMLHGKRTVAEKIVYDAMEIIQSRLEGDDMAIDTVKRAIENVKPPLGRRLRPQPPREDDGRVPRERADGRREWSGRSDEEARRHPEDGRVEQGVRPLSLVNARW